MAKKLKTYQTSVGFHDLAVAAPSMKAALAAWGAGRNLFHDGVARESDDPKVIAATMAAPGVVLKRPVGSHTAFKTQSELPTDLAAAGPKKAAAKKSVTPKTKPPPKIKDPASDRKAALAFEREQKRRERERAMQEAAQEKERERAQRAVDKAQAALDAARRKHEKTAADIEAARKALEAKSRAEDARWENEKARLDAALRRAQR